MLRLLTFGGLTLVDGDAPVTGAASQRSRLALLAVLAAAGPAGISRDKLLACLWPESEDERARHALKQAVYALRRDLGNEHAIAGTATLTLDPTIVSSDIKDFEDALARGDDGAAVAVYAGPFLDGVFVRGAAEFDQWASSERARLERACLEAIARLAKAAEATGDLPAAVQWWRKGAAAEPLSGRVALSLMRALAESGDVSAAIQHARVHEAMVRAELESGADDAVTSFAEELKRGDWRPTLRPIPAPARPEPVAIPIPVVAPTDPIVAPSVVPQQAATKGRSPWVLAAVGIVTVIAAAVGGALAREQVSSFISPATAPSSRRIVVAGLANRTGDKGLDPVGALAADWIVRRLIESEFEVVDYRTSALASRLISGALPTANDTASALAKQTGAATVITGSYYKEGDTLLFEARIIDPARKVTLRAVGPVSGRTSEPSQLVGALANRISASMTASADTTPGASTTALVTPPSVEAFVHASRAWEMFFTRPADTSAVFAELQRAMRIDSGYTTPRLMRAYVLDVKEQWADLAAAVRDLDRHRSRMGRVELAALSLFEADLNGDLAGRLRASRELLRLSPGSVDMSLLVAVSASYLHRPAEVLEVLQHSNPDHGINTITPMYWAWRAVSEHSLGRFEDEMRSAREMSQRFPAQLYGAQAVARALAARGDTAALGAHLKELGFGQPVLNANSRTVALLAARELRAHGFEAAAVPIFARVASLGVPAGASRDDWSKYAIALYESGNYAAARAAYTRLLSSNPKDLDALGRLGSIAIRMNDTATARQIETRLMEWSEPYVLGRPTYWRAHYASLSGRHGEAITLLHSALAAGFRAMDLNIITVHEEPDFIPLWREPAFRELLSGRKDAATRS